MKQIKIALKTMAIKARVYNRIRTFLYRKQLEQISTEDKIKFFDELYQLNWRAHWELNWYKRKREDKAEIQRLREERKKAKQ